MTNEIIVGTHHELSEPERKKIERSLSRLSKLATLLDDQFELPIIKQRIGLDPIIGLIPGVGDWVSWVVSVYIIWESLRLKVPLKILFGIGKNITFDFILGYVPGVGDVMDIVIKANKRSVSLLLNHFDASPITKEVETITLPVTATQKPTSPAIIRYPLGLGLIFFFFLLALIPISLSYLFLQWTIG